MLIKILVLNTSGQLFKVWLRIKYQMLDFTQLKLSNYAINKWKKKYNFYLLNKINFELKKI